MAEMMKRPRTDRLLGRITQLELAGEVPEPDREERRREVAPEAFQQWRRGRRRPDRDGDASHEERREEADAHDVVEMEMREQQVDVPHLWVDLPRRVSGCRSRHRG